jgi:cytochrome c oxidase subunit I+III
VPAEPWGIRSIPEIDARYPIWDQPDFVQDIDEGRFYLPDAEEGRRETVITSPVDARPVQCLRVPGPTWLSFWAALFTGGFFILSTYHLWWPAALSGVVAVGFILVWLWTGTSVVPEKWEKDVGLGLTLPLYASGSSSVGWWAMFITMLGDMTAYAGIVFGYFFYWTVREDFPPEASLGPGWAWPVAGGGALLTAWVLTLMARRWNALDRSGAVLAALLAAAGLSVGGAGALLAGPLLSDMDPSQHVYPAIVWLLVIWTAVHAVVGVVMQLYCVARRVAGRLTPRYDIDIRNVALYWHFVAVTVVVCVAVIAGFPKVA